MTNVNLFKSGKQNIQEILIPDSLKQIFNYLKIDYNFSTSGQPSESGFELISQAGFQTVINLAPHNVENSLKDEAGLLQRLSIEYVHIPVDFFNPKEIDFRAFCDALNKR